MGKITLGLREALERHGFDFTVQLMECCGCTGFWMGFGIGWWKATAPAGVLYAIAFGLCVAASNLLMNAVVVFGDRQP